MDAGGFVMAVVMVAYNFRGGCWCFCAGDGGGELIVALSGGGCSMLEMVLLG